MSPKLLHALALVIGAAVILNGFLGRNLWNDVEMPISDEWRPDKKPPSKTARIFYILFGGGLFTYGVIGFLR